MRRLVFIIYVGIHQAPTDYLLDNIENSKVTDLHCQMKCYPMFIVSSVGTLYIMICFIYCWHFLLVTHFLCYKETVNRYRTQNEQWGICTKIGKQTIVCSWTVTNTVDEKQRESSICFNTLPLLNKRPEIKQTICTYWVICSICAQTGIWVLVSVNKMLNVLEKKFSCWWN